MKCWHKYHFPVHTGMLVILQLLWMWFKGETYIGKACYEAESKYVFVLTNED